MSQTLREWDLISVRRVESYASAGRDVRLPDGVFFALGHVRAPEALPGLARLLDAVDEGAFGVRPAECLPHSVPVGATGRSCYAPAIARAIHNIHTREALPLLARLLDSPNLESQYMAVQGLALYALGLPSAPAFRIPDRRPPQLSRAEFESYLFEMPSVRVFENGPIPYIAFWKDWYRERANVIQAP